ncbi:hypothetical protein [uncultured Vagococcus sp.]|uniref:hypothetical protein n=1 Tax=uncultured Vagococcus sp. TaxID=189676 RepID=UPI0028D3AFAE|nr:hypothetical protein [uncultured Vagococcus sp.]
MGEKGVSLTGAYPSINGSYGGNQEWFRDDVFSNGDLIRFGGCGLISMADTLLYLASQHQLLQPLPDLVHADKLTASTYQLFVESLFYRYLQPWRNPLFNPKRYRHDGNFVLGIQGWQLRRGFNRFFQQQQSKFYSTKGKADFQQLIQQQVMNNRPVPLMIGPTLEMLPKGLRFLGRHDSSVTYHISHLSSNLPLKDVAAIPTMMNAHWVTITGYYEEAGKAYVVISSWSEPYLMDLTAYLSDRDWIGGIMII